MLIKQAHEAQLQELAQSIAASGVVQPIVVKRLSENKFQLITGERRWLDDDAILHRLILGSSNVQGTSEAMLTAMTMNEENMNAPVRSGKSRR